MYNEETRTNWSHYSPCQVKSIDTIDNIIAYRLINTYVVDGIRSIVSSFREQTARGSCAHYFGWLTVVNHKAGRYGYFLFLLPSDAYASLSATKIPSYLASRTLH